MDSMGQESEELKRLREELTEVKRTASLAESTKQEEIGRLKQKYEDEIQSLNYILKETVADALHTGDHERNELRKKNQMLELQLHDLKQHLNSSDSDSLISHVFRTLKSPSSPGHLGDNGNAHDFSTGESIQEYRNENKRLRKQILNLEERFKRLEEDDSKMENDQDRLRESTKGDLRMYVTVLTTQKQVLQEDVTCLTEKLQQIQNVVLRLSKTFGELHEKIVDNEKLEDNVIGPMISRHMAELNSLRNMLHRDGFQWSESYSSQLGDDCKANDEQTFPVSATSNHTEKRRSQSVSEIAGIVDEASAMEDKRSCSTNTIGVPEKSIAMPKFDLLPENECLSTSPSEYDTASLQSRKFDADLSSIPSAPDTGFSASNKQQGLSASSGCEMCSNYELKVQSLQTEEKRLADELAGTLALSNRYRAELEKEQQLRSEIEEQLNSCGERLEEQLKTLITDLGRHSKNFEESLKEKNEKMEKLEKEIQNFERERGIFVKRIENLQERYEKLLGKHRKHAEQLREEVIDLPKSCDELQLCCLRLREELIEATGAREHLEETLSYDLSFLKAQLESEQTAKDQMENNLSEEINQIRASNSSMKTQLEEYKNRISALQKTEQLHKKSVDEIEILKQRIKKLEFEVAEYKQRLTTLQHQLDNSEATQLDFVRLSQSLQVQLEKIRAAEQEVRWQHEEDVLLCNQCKQAFTKSKRKLHCYHCGKIYCASCLNRTVAAGPAGRPSPVCDVCHTILVQNSAPYFSNQPPKDA